MSDRKSKIVALQLNYGNIIGQMESSLRALSTTPLPLKTSYQIGRLIQKLNTDYEFFAAKRKDLLEQHGTTTDGTNFTFTNQESMEKFNEGMKALVESPILTAINWVPLTAESLDGVKLTVADILSLTPLLDIESFDEMMAMDGQTVIENAETQEEAETQAEAA